MQAARLHSSYSALVAISSFGNGVGYDTTLRAKRHPFAFDTRLSLSTVTKTPPSGANAHASPSPALGLHRFTDVAHTSVSATGAARHPCTASSRFIVMAGASHEPGGGMHPSSLAVEHEAAAADVASATSKNAKKPRTVDTRQRTTRHWSARRRAPRSLRLRSARSGPIYDLLLHARLCEAILEAEEATLVRRHARPQAVESNPSDIVDPIGSHDGNAEVMVR